jgi:hypothetical protein
MALYAKLDASKLNDVAGLKPAPLAREEPLLIDERTTRTVEIADRELLARGRERGVTCRHAARPRAFLLQQVEASLAAHAVAENDFAGIDGV